MIKACFLESKHVVQLKGVLDRILGDEGDMKAIHLTGRYCKSSDLRFQASVSRTCTTCTVLYCLIVRNLPVFNSKVASCGSQEGQYRYLPNP